MSENKILISPSILACDFGDVTKECKRAEKAGADMLHVDVMDGHFVPNISIGPQMTETVNKAVDIPLDVHLMISEPLKYIDAFVKAGSDIITIHVESDSKIPETLQKIKAAGKKTGLSLNPDTPFADVKPYLDDVDMLLFMSVYPGFGGQKFMPEVLDKVKEAKSYLAENGYDIDIEIDGGINLETAKEAVSAGANILVAGTAVYGHSDIAYAIEEMRKA